MEFRSYRNPDPPLIAQLWRECTQQPGLLQPMTTGLLETYVINKTYFDPQGLILAEDEQGLVGLAHAGFGPTSDESSLDTDLGATCLLLVHPRQDWQTVAGELLTRSESYLRKKGAQVLYGGSLAPLNPFYLGLYGGSELPGILDAHVVCQDFYRAHHYRAVDHVRIYRKALAGARPLMDRKLMQVRRRTQVAIVEEPPLRSWWEANTQGEFERRQFQLLDNQMGNTLAIATLRNLDPPSAGIATGGSGLVEFWVDETQHRQGLGSYLLNEIFKYLQDSGFGYLEAQTMERNTVGISFYEKNGFELTAEGSVFRKEG
ncbi:MAG: GNAT family N-acetyltransferase [Pirellulales bacterium]|nr:GNAT family N-acetyltransferase [Pirellulales bacterium]